MQSSNNESKRSKICPQKIRGKEICIQTVHSSFYISSFLSHSAVTQHNLIEPYHSMMQLSYASLFGFLRAPGYCTTNRFKLFVHCLSTKFVKSSLIVSRNGSRYKKITKDRVCKQNCLHELIFHQFQALSLELSLVATKPPLN